jgi:predicted ribosome quality control (RQC) complex YloA/Tae2 family protein
MIIGREDGENRFLEGYRKQYTHLIVTSHNGPLVLIDGDAVDQDLELAAQIAARFSQGRDANRVDVEIHTLDGGMLTKQVTPLTCDQLPQTWYL